MTDFTARDESSIYLLTAHSEDAKDWAAEHLPEDALRFGKAYVVDWRFMQDIIEGIKGDGLTIEEEM